MRNALYQFYWQIQRRVVPGLRPSQYEFAETLTSTLRDRPTWLDVGCGRRPLPDWVPGHLERGILERVGRAVGTDLDLASLRDNSTLKEKVQSSADALPFGAQSFDVVSANMVMEHVDRPAIVLRELKRVLRPGGALVFHTPNRRYWAIAIAHVVPDGIKTLLANLLEGRASQDVFPTHYRFNDKDEIERLARAEGFEIERLDTVSSSAVLAVTGPAVLPELLWIRALQRPGFAQWRSNLIGVLRVPRDNRPAAGS